MRLALAALLLTGCIIEAPDSDYPPPSSGGGSGSGWGSGWGGGGGSTDYGCHADTECPTTNVCARNGECLPATDVRLVSTTWTLQGEPASDVSCEAAPKLSITFMTSGGEVFGYSPVPCDAGKFTVDKLPTRFTSVALVRNSEGPGGVSGSFDGEGTATVDLPY